MPMRHINTVESKHISEEPTSHFAGWWQRFSSPDRIPKALSEYVSQDLKKKQVSAAKQVQKKGTQSVWLS